MAIPLMSRQPGWYRANTKYTTMSGPAHYVRCSLFICLNLLIHYYFCTCFYLIVTNQAEHEQSMKHMSLRNRRRCPIKLRSHNPVWEQGSNGSRSSHYHWSGTVTTHRLQLSDFGLWGMNVSPLPWLQIMSMRAFFALSSNASKSTEMYPNNGIFSVSPASCDQYITCDY